jgi:hypothetical protein
MRNCDRALIDFSRGTARDWLTPAFRGAHPLPDVVPGTNRASPARCHDVAAISSSPIGGGDAAATKTKEQCAFHGSVEGAIITV